MPERGSGQKPSAQAVDEEPNRPHGSQPRGGALASDEHPFGNKRDTDDLGAECNTREDANHGDLALGDRATGSQESKPPDPGSPLSDTLQGQAPCRGDVT